MKHRIRSQSFQHLRTVALVLVLLGMVGSSLFTRQAVLADSPVPSLVIEPIQGPLTLQGGGAGVYSVAIHNDGAPAGSILLSITFDDALAPDGTILAENGFFCTADTQRYLCDGGALTSGAWTILTFDVRGDVAGDGTIQVSASVDGTGQSWASAPLTVAVGAPPAAS